MNRKFLLSLSALALALSACGDDVTRVESTTRIGGVGTVGSLDEVDSCSAGEMVLVRGEGRVWICADDNSWIPLKGGKGEPGDRGETGDSGEPGDKGAPGAPGDSCSAVKIEEGVEIDCGGRVDTLWAGRDEVGVCGGVPHRLDRSFCDARDNRIYKYVVLGSQTWMAENLDYGRWVRVEDKGAVQSLWIEDGRLVVEKWCYNDSAEYCARYGALYQWHMAMSLFDEYRGRRAAAEIQTPHRGICPEGWHVPTAAEWSTLRDWADSANGGEADDAGRSLKSAVGWGGEAGNGTDDWGFNGLPSGFRRGGFSFQSAGVYTFWWSATEADYFDGMDSLGAKGRYLLDPPSFFAETEYDRESACSLRCLKD